MGHGNLILANISFERNMAVSSIYYDLRTYWIMLYYIVHDSISIVVMVETHHIYTLS
jgi:hypothetical protein